LAARFDFIDIAYTTIADGAGQWIGETGFEIG
jgi:hypothetical protein